MQEAKKGCSGLGFHVLKALVDQFIAHLICRINIAAIGDSCRSCVGESYRQLTRRAHDTSVFFVRFRFAFFLEAAPQIVSATVLANALPKLDRAGVSGDPIVAVRVCGTWANIWKTAPEDNENS